VCPRCTASPAGLEEIPVGERTLHACPSCHGLWLSPEVFNAALIETDLQAAVLVVDRGQEPLPQPNANARCPVCRADMVRTEYGQRSGIIVDGCRHHGIWLDPSELSRIIDHTLDHQADELEAPDVRIARLSPDGLRGFTLGPAPADR